MFPDWFAGVAFAAIGIGALVPAAIMSIAAANLFTRNIFKEYLKRDATPRQEAQVSKIASLVVKFGAVLFILCLDPQFSIDLQLIGGVIILQTLPAVALGLYTRWFHRWGLIAGWVAGMGLGMWMLYQIPNAATKHAHFGGSAFPINKWFDPTRSGSTPRPTIYVGFVAVLVNAARGRDRHADLRAVKAPDGSTSPPATTTSPTRATPASPVAPPPNNGRNRIRRPSASWFARTVYSPFLSSTASVLTGERRRGNQGTTAEVVSWYRAYSG